MTGDKITSMRFSCRACGRCCLTRGKYGFVYVSRAERRRLALLLKIPTLSFTRRYCRKTDGFFHLLDNGRACIFLVRGKCQVYAARPGQCITWPFWPENVRAGRWAPGVPDECPGIGRGRNLTATEVQKRVQVERDREASVWQW